METKNWKKQVSVHKFLRIARNSKSVKIRGLYCSALYSHEAIQAIEAYEFDGFLYMLRKCDKQEGNRLKTYFVRYKIGSYKADREFPINGGKV